MAVHPIGTRFIVQQTVVTDRPGGVNADYIGKTGEVTGWIGTPPISHTVRFDDETLSNFGAWSFEALRPVHGNAEVQALRERINDDREYIGDTGLYVGQRVEVVHWSEDWNGPATIVEQGFGGDVIIRTDGPMGRGAFSARNIRPLNVADLDSPARPGDRVRVVDTFGPSLAGKEGNVILNPSQTDDAGDTVFVEFPGHESQICADPGETPYGAFAPRNLILIERAPEPLVEWERALLAGDDEVSGTNLIGELRAMESSTYEALQESRRETDRVVARCDELEVEVIDLQADKVSLTSELNTLTEVSQARIDALRGELDQNHAHVEAMKVEAADTQQALNYALDMLESADRAQVLGFIDGQRSVRS